MIKKKSQKDRTKKSLIKERLAKGHRGGGLIQPGIPRSLFEGLFNCYIYDVN